jgi:hypothetical protein
MKQLLIIALVTFFCISCKKEKEVPAVNYAETLKSTKWGGKYYNLTNPSVQISYTISLDSGNFFEWKGGGNTFLGDWVVSGKQITFTFAIGAKNKWNGEINDSGNELKNISIPVPDGFRVISCVKNP